MWIECDNDATKRLYVDDVMDEPIEFNDNGKALVKGDVGSQLTERYDAVHESGESVEESSSESDNEE